MHTTEQAAPQRAACFYYRHIERIEEKRREEKRREDKTREDKKEQYETNKQNLDAFLVNNTSFPIAFLGQDIRVYKSKCSLKKSSISL
ncbi:MAG: hypothetical protein SOT07_02300 [Paludibacteraceae bacterium]|nr:hypothetical protein [Paludibacteraceae bacterium]